ncbi:MAG: hypothetical protein DHS20C15_06540 [Planctomycetota bacterium]|nr:MAG: hypothetical protein DHS20C15_06540 [Planctomycetota bacterium]
MTDPTLVLCPLRPLLPRTLAVLLLAAGLDVPGVLEPPPLEPLALGGRAAGPEESLGEGPLY